MDYVDKLLPATATLWALAFIQASANSDVSFITYTLRQV
jgi:hypothetical protein